MATAKDTLNPLSEISLLFGRDGLAHKDLESLTDAITNLSSTLEKRTGKSKEKEEPAVGNLFKDIKDFSKGFFDTAVKNPFKYTKNTLVSAKDFITGKSTMPENLGKVETPEESIPQTTEQPKIEPTLDKEVAPKIETTITEKDKVEPVVSEPMLSEKDKVEPVVSEPMLSEKDKVEPVVSKPMLSEKDKVEPLFDTKAYDPATIKPTLDMVEPINQKEDKANLQSNADNKILSDMVEVLNDLRDDKSQKQILNEAIAIRKIISDQAKKVELSAGVEPNSEESKQEDREKLAEAIARRLENVMSNLGSGGLGIPDLMDRKPGKPAGKTPSKTPGGASGGGRFGKILGLGGKLLGGASLAYGAYEASEFLGETGYSDKMAEGAGKKAEAAFRENVAPTIDPIKAGISVDEAKAALENGSPRDIEKLGGKEALENIVKGKETNNMRTIQKITSGNTAEEANIARAKFASTDPRRIDNINVEPKEKQVNIKDILNKVNEENTQLKMFSDTTQSTQMIAPIVSNKTINNTEQTIVGASPSPHPTTNSFMRWQNKRSAFTD